MLAIKYYIHNATYISFLENEDVDVILNIVDAFVVQLFKINKSVRCILWHYHVVLTAGTMAEQ